uniref:Small nuclear ribonucleoprotein polypeptide A n=1 Tax=Pipistrellus kuhlii TaxID=59472 RepID=A0A7J7QW67_PIPKU|nr:small nuclear ribonucleoprotein polypeptide A' [Pipistrellus kuhlii]
MERAARCSAPFGAASRAFGDIKALEIRKLDGFPLLRRLKSLLVNNSRTCLAGAAEFLNELGTYSELIRCGQGQPNCRTSIAVRCHWFSDNEIRKLDGFPLLRRLKNLLVNNNRTCILRNPVTNKKHYRLYVIYKVPQVRELDFQKVKLKNAIASASTLAEVERLKGLLQSGQIPGRERRAGPGNDGEEEVEEDTIANGS